MQSFRRALLGLRLAIIGATQEGAAVRTVQALQSTPELTDAVPLVQHYGIASRPHPGCRAITATVGGEQSPVTIAIATNDGRYHLTLAEGEVALHTDQGDHVWLRRGKIEVLSVTEVDVIAPVVNITATTSVTITSPMTTMTGDLMVDGNISDQAGAHGNLGALRTAYDAHEHPIVNIETGGATISTGLTDHLV